MDATERAIEAARVMKALSRNKTSIETLQNARPELIRAARRVGVTWESIADAAGVSRITVINLAKVEPAE